MKAKNAAFDLVADIGTAMVFLSDKSKEGMSFSSYNSFIVYKAFKIFTFIFYNVKS